jgi:ATP-binding cassette, subfamily C (CFTR/MRP), member 1
MDRIIVLNRGQIADMGPYEEILQRSTGLVEQTEGSLGISEGVSDVESRHEANLKSAEATPQESLDLTRRTGSWAVYRYYARSAGLVTVFFWIFWTFVGAVFTSVMRKSFALPAQQLILGAEHC